MRAAPATSITLALIVAAGGALVHQHRTSPDYALRQIARALETHDTDLLDRHVDVPALIADAADQLVAVASARDCDALTPDPSLADATPETLRRLLVTLAQDALIEEVLGAPIGPPPGADSALLGRLTNYSSLTRSAVRSIVGVERHGESARAHVLLEETGLDTVLVLTVQLERRDGVWKFVGVPGLDEYIATVGELQARRLAEERESGRYHEDWPSYLEARKRMMEPLPGGRGGT